MALYLNSQRPRRCGMTREYNLPSLHENVQPPARKRLPTPEDLTAPPIDSSDEASIALEKNDGEDSEDSEFGGGKKNSVFAPSGKKEETALRNGVEDRAPSIWDPPSMDRGSPKSSNESSNSQKRSISMLDDDMNPFQDFEMPRKRKANSRMKQTTYGSSQTRPANIHLGSVDVDIQNEDQPSSPEPRTGKRGFKAPLKSKLSSKSRDPETLPKAQLPTFKKPPRSQRASQISSQPGQDASDVKSKPKFNVPKRTSPRKTGNKANFEDGSQDAVLDSDPKADASTIASSSRSFNRPLRSASTNKSKPIDNIQSAVHATADKLGLTDLENVVPSSGMSIDNGSDQRLSHDEDNLNDHDLPDLRDILPSSISASQNATSSFREPSVSSGLSSPPDSPQPESPPKAKCPFCKAEVDQDFFDEATGGGQRLRISQQARFCKAHKIRTANAEWIEKGYPDIDWRNFDRSLAEYHPAIEDILNGKKFSFYRNVFSDSIKSGKNRTLQQTMLQGGNLEGLSPGYYGSRGAKIMVDNIITHFAPKLRRLSTSDKLISASGVSSYVQAVLAPEMAVLLTMNDMKLDDEEAARAVLRESVEIGNLVNEEEEEEILDLAEAEVEVEVGAGGSRDDDDDDGIIEIV